mmetsp:Transcript_33729/g.70127  ORF Transcript_33729/g.70127 Transcript_33729/m.70127 type:complete len:146 (-) Transcript_33729:215-652(-)|eukprot:CAMPEP_0172471824 /NCGR_PEP_ID=MMETSP1065-20121228/68018_1 /TAXON_ID=265537 /ORGANISM="Amphiprora paludosa, Strain CCMP125" /LENGTH=145 /DNA_ID=CAMNT_0013229939 /DNA_START=882 /DNA_END=1319 /DNA_ORIENTATION=-
MTASAPLRFPLSASHNRKRRSVRPFQQENSQASPLKSIAKGTTPSLSEVSSSATVDTVDSAASSLDEQTSAAFRSTIWNEAASEEVEELWTLKRASPVYDDDDEFYQYESPSKRTKTVILDWSNRLTDEVPLLLDSLDIDQSESS